MEQENYCGFTKCQEKKRFLMMCFENANTIEWLKLKGIKIKTQLFPMPFPEDTQQKKEKKKKTNSGFSVLMQQILTANKRVPDLFGRAFCVHGSPMRIRKV